MRLAVSDRLFRFFCMREWPRRGRRPTRVACDPPPRTLTELRSHMWIRSLLSHRFAARAPQGKLEACSSTTSINIIRVCCLFCALADRPGAYLLSTPQVGVISLSLLWCISTSALGARSSHMLHNAREEALALRWRAAIFLANALAAKWATLWAIRSRRARGHVCENGQLIAPPLNLQTSIAFEAFSLDVKCIFYRLRIGYFEKDVLH